MELRYILKVLPQWKTIKCANTSHEKRWMRCSIPFLLKAGLYRKVSSLSLILSMLLLFMQIASHTSIWVCKLNFLDSLLGLRLSDWRSQLHSIVQLIISVTILVISCFFFNIVREMFLILKLAMCYISIKLSSIVTICIGSSSWQGIVLRPQQPT